MTKVEFNKVCFPVLGRENGRLHNLLICSILKNSCNAKVPPPPAIIHDNLQIGDVLLSPRKSGASVRLAAKVEHVLIDQLMHFTTVDLQDSKESRQRFDKAMNGCAQFGLRCNIIFAVHPRLVLANLLLYGLRYKTGLHLGSRKAHSGQSYSAVGTKHLHLKCMVESSFCCFMEAS
ncbi:hypothetical protein F3Y22_tig00109957pilonHSYRG00192 [Hibiscus syriacus]|uniref:Uncharacterized protein n=1 Tax=Hibiscus syriacus TaxID=106335 RepID=A0A6A3BS40_HIBSY|nr:hypothetical protein F3Y22_tig00109957pilonHSYRG00192 [Hibiscus syriacus]